jgi:PPP family 3-phenylpropionic acid transporter
MRLGIRGDRARVVASYFFMFVGAGVYLPYLPRYLAHLGWPGWQIGVAFGTQPLLRWAGAFAWAYVADRWRVRRRLLVACALGGGACFVPLLFLESFPAVALVLTAIGLLHGPLIPMLDATALDHLDRLGGDYGRLRLWGSAGFILGALGSAPLVQAFSPRVVPLLLAAPNLLLPAVLLGLPAGQPGEPARFRPPWRLLTPPLATFLATAFLLEASSGAWNGFFAVHAAALGLPDTVPGLAWGLAVLAEVALFQWGGGLTARIPPARLVLAVVLFTAVRWAASAWATGATLVVAVQLGHAVTFSVFHLAAQALLGRLVPAESSTGGQTLYGMARFGLGATAGLWLAGALVDRLGTRSLFGVEALVVLAGVVPALRLRRLVPRA